MDENERREAERLADLNSLGYTKISGPIRRSAFIKGYAAACEAKQKEIDYINGRDFEHYGKDLLANERARFAKLLEACKRWQKSPGSWADVILAEAIGEYEGSRD